ncbi:hypothetical protein J4573_03520 [Actinomadura barringtoniae]|uniref:Exo-alpha-sialidase n=1 Tax=Actinomadura barringtoniae TaxID=1427535 RepID=A0A939P6I3_9ACTN|nr:hypothetical protein [Actinomadura barringtoniae]MBO2446145.1 hypothetical protein [Actinomadura barringtoniae]
MRKLIPLSLAVLALAGCGTGQGMWAGAPASETGGTPPVDAALVTPSFGWVLTADRLLVTSDGGRTFTDTRAPLPTSTVRAAHFTDALHGFATASSGSTLTTARTSDGGRTWTRGTMNGPEYASLSAAAGDARHGAVLAQTSRILPSATLLATSDGGASWSASAAPAGELSMESNGRIWVAGDGGSGGSGGDGKDGGSGGSGLSSSTDQGRHWTTTTVKVDGSFDSKAVAPPTGGVLPVTLVTKSDQTQVALLTSTDKGRSWTETNRVSVHGRTGPGVRVPVAAAGGGPLVVDTAGGHAYRVPAHRAAAMATPDLRPSGLPEGAGSVTFAPDGRTGWALAAYGRCAKGKTGCSLYHPLSMTTDGGVTWRQVRLWQERLN